MVSHSHSNNKLHKRDLCGGAGAVDGAGRGDWKDVWCMAAV